MYRRNVCRPVSATGGRCAITEYNSPTRHFLLCIHTGSSERCIMHRSRTAYVADESFPTLRFDRLQHLPCILIVCSY